jgi:hypothetical protein
MAQKYDPNDSFNDIMTSLSGILMLVIILIVLDTKQTKVLIPTPMERDPKLTPVYLECAPSGEIGLVDVEGLEKLARERLSEIAKASAGNREAMLNQLAAATVENENHRVNLMSKAMQVLEITRKPDASFHKVASEIDASQTAAALDWFSSLLQATDPKTHYLVFIVRSTDASFQTFKRARAHAWMKGVNVAYEVFDNTEPIRMGASGEFPRAQ